MRHLGFSKFPLSHPSSISSICRFDPHLGNTLTENFLVALAGMHPSYHWMVKNQRVWELEGNSCFSPGVCKLSLAWDTFQKVLYETPTWKQRKVEVFWENHSLEPTYFSHSPEAGTLENSSRSRSLSHRFDLTSPVSGKETGFWVVK